MPIATSGSRQRDSGAHYGRTSARESHRDKRRTMWALTPSPAPLPHQPLTDVSIQVYPHAYQQHTL